MSLAPAPSACPACAAAPLAQAASKGAQSALDGFDEVLFALPKVHCAACISAVETRLNELAGVAEPRVNLSLKRVSLKAAPWVEEETIIAALASIGFEAHPLDAATIGGAADRAGRDLLLRLAVAGFAMMNVMLLSVAVWSGATDATRDVFHLISALIAVPAVGFSAQPFFINALSALRVRRLNMDVPISLAIVLAVGMSLFETFQSGENAYFDAALSLTFFLLIGRYLDHRTRASARSAASELAALEVHRAQRIEHGQPVAVRVADLAIGDHILVPHGMRIPVDGVLSSDSAQLDRAFLTGESAVQVLQAGDVVRAGEVNMGDPVTLQATAVGQDTTLRQIAALVETAEGGRNSYTALADRAAAIYAPAVHLLAFAAFVGWAAIGGDIRFALNVAIAVLIITCPCALGLAVPAVATAAIGKLFGHGFLVKHATALERIAEVDTVIFDKTGTLTMPGQTRPLAGLSRTEAGVALALAQASNHPVSQALCRALGTQVSAEQLHDITELPGQGMQANWQGKTVRLGQAGFVGAQGAGTWLKIGDAPARRADLSERLRPGAAQAIAALKAQGLHVEMLTGDAPDPAHSVASQLGITTVHSRIEAAQKHALIEDAKARGARVLMVGDGINDTAALAAAHASIAPASALDAARTAADIVALDADFTNLGLVVAVARKSTRLSKQNFGIALCYNLIAVPIALAGLATPLLAALAMSSSSITVLLNAMRVRSAK